MMRVLATVALSMCLVVGATAAVGTASAESVTETAGGELAGGSYHCPTDIHNYLWNIWGYLEACLS